MPSLGTATGPPPGVVEAFGDDALFPPAPDSGKGGVIGAASWQFGVSATSANPEGADAFIEFALTDKWFSAFSDGTGLIPPTASAAKDTKFYAEGAPLEVFHSLSEAQSLVRPVTPGCSGQSLRKSA